MRHVHLLKHQLSLDFLEGPNPGNRGLVIEQNMFLERKLSGGE